MRCSKNNRPPVDQYINMCDRIRACVDSVLYSTTWIWSVSGQQKRSNKGTEIQSLIGIRSDRAVSCSFLLSVGHLNTLLCLWKCRVLVIWCCQFWPWSVPFSVNLWSNISGPKSPITRSTPKWLATSFTKWVSVIRARNKSQLIIDFWGGDCDKKVDRNGGACWVVAFKEHYWLTPHSGLFSMETLRW